MITTKLYLDTRASADRPAPIKVSITKRGDTAYILTGVKVLPEQWDKQNQRIIKRPDAKPLNNFILRFKLGIDEQLRELVLSGRAAEMPVADIKNEIAASYFGRPQSQSFADYFASFIADKSARTAAIYSGHIRAVYKFDESLASRPLSAVSRAWVTQLDRWLTENYAPNTRRQVLAILQTMFKRAAAEKLIASSPMKGVKLSYVVTRKRNLSQQQFRTLWYAEPETIREERALDLFRFSFLTIAMNTVDIAKLTPDSIFNGRIEYDRAKTGKHYSVKVVDELLPLIDKYNDGKRLFSAFNVFEDYTHFVSSCDHQLAAISQRLGLPKISLYWARHTWASMAAELDLSVDVISSALGHSHGARVTMVYINQDQRKVDEANRLVINYALYEDGV